MTDPTPTDPAPPLPAYALTDDEARTVAAAREAAHNPELDDLAAYAEESGDYVTYDEKRADHAYDMADYVPALLDVIARLTSTPARRVTVSMGL